MFTEAQVWQATPVLDTTWPASVRVRWPRACSTSRNANSFRPCSCTACIRGQVALNCVLHKRRPQGAGQIWCTTSTAKHGCCCERGCGHSSAPGGHVTQGTGSISGSVRQYEGYFVRLRRRYGGCQGGVSALACAPSSAHVRPPVHRAQSYGKEQSASAQLSKPSCRPKQRI